MPAYMNKSKTDSWGTPKDLYKTLNDEFHFDEFDPCPLTDDPTFNGLQMEWAQTTFVNPPYSNLKSTKKSGIGWIEKAHLQAQKGKTIVLLIPARTDTTWFHDIILANNYQVRFMKGRTKFINKETGKVEGTAPFPTMVVVMKS